MAVSMFLADKLNAAFDLLDADGDGYLTEEDHALMGRRVAERFGCAADSPEARRIVEAYLSIWSDVHLGNDIDGDGKVTRDEFISGTMALRSDPRTADAALGGLAEHFMAIADQNGDGVIDEREYTAFLDGTAPGLPTGRAAEAFQHLDADGDGQLTHVELKRALIEYYTSEEPAAVGNWLWGRAVVPV